MGILKINASLQKIILDFEIAIPLLKWQEASLPVAL